MANSLASLIQSYLTRYLAGEISLHVFEDWFVAQSWDLDTSRDRTASDLAHEIELALVEYSSGHWTENEIRDLLRRLANTVVIEQDRVHTSSSDPIIRIPYLYVDTRPGVALA